MVPSSAPAIRGIGPRHIPHTPPMRPVSSSTNQSTGGHSFHSPQAAAARTASLEARVDVLERRIIEDCLQRNNYRRKETAAELGISRVTLYNKMKKFGLM